VKLHTRVQILVAAPGLAHNLRLSKWEIIFSPELPKKMQYICVLRCKVAYTSGSLDISAFMPNCSGVSIH
jgi:hypothetical protein